MSHQSTGFLALALNLTRLDSACVLDDCAREVKAAQHTAVATKLSERLEALFRQPAIAQVAVAWPSAQRACYEVSDSAAADAADAEAGGVVEERHDSLLGGEELVCRRLRGCESPLSHGHCDQTLLEREMTKLVEPAILAPRRRCNDRLDEGHAVVRFKPCTPDGTILR
eukprot:5898277-Prymnesium_polylepis.1